MIGQEKLLAKINSYTLATFPRNILLFGERGCGKHALVNYISKKFNLEIVNVIIPSSSDNESLTDILAEYNQCVINKIYLIDLDTIPQKQQNKFLKFIEEPGKCNYIILISSAESQVLETVKNRCIKFYFQEYTKEELKQFKTFENEEIYNICRTPGQLNSITDSSFKSLKKLCETIIEKLQLATYANAASISQQINYKEEYDKFDFNLFFETLSYVLRKKYIETGNKQYYNSDKYINSFIYINSYVQESRIKAINKENFILNFLLNYKNYMNSIV